MPAEPAAPKAAPKPTSHAPGDVEVEFTCDYVVSDEAATAYTKGQKVKMSDSSANHFCNRGLAERTK